MDSKTRVLALNCSSSADLVVSLTRGLAVEVEHADFTFPWEEIAARRAGRLDNLTPVPDRLRPQLAETDVVFGFHVPAGLVDAAPRLRWIETPATGCDHLNGTGVFERRVSVTTVGGLFAGSVAEHAFALLLGLTRHLREATEAQARREWRPAPVRELRGSTLAVVGLGRIGREVARLGRCFGMRVVGLRRSAAAADESVDRVYGRGELASLLAEADFVVLTVAGTAETAGMLGTRELAAMKPGALLVNVARGSVVDENALADAIASGHLGAAGLDVFAEEPLPAEHRIWSLPRVLITPHTAITLTDRMERSLRHFCDNLHRYCGHQPLADQIDPDRGY